MSTPEVKADCTLVWSGKAWPTQGGMSTPEVKADFTLVWQSMANQGRHVNTRSEGRLYIGLARHGQ
ncbi:hypothetical protein LSAT2_010445, partial [Lamellibrachia satsuma]